MQLKSYLNRFAIFSEEEIDRILPLFSVRKVEKGDYFIREGHYCSEVAFIEKGVFRSFYTSEAGEEITYCFRFQNEFMTAYSAFITGNKSVESFQAISDGELLVVPKMEIEQLAEQNPKWTLFLKIVAEQQYLELEGRVFQLQRDSAQKRYQDLVDNQPEYIQQISLQHLASYLGITQRHLSRIRKQVVL
ncbi:Crp/Fnr family transcriptional regulator [Fluviicola sp.]|uniref:Crp/Fnr family transcriptional regulator n=1 Tax=Fluviicola sp. TaxID=1917219 RepID=UPI002604B32D|nr:Crp/Fnr family transcriptional regulator [Fluviicola sp.]